VLAVGDSAFREKCLGKMAEMGRRDRTVLFVSHDLGAITRLCTRAVWLEGGRIQSDGSPREIVSRYLEKSTPERLLDVEFDAEPGTSVSVRRASVRDAATGEVLTAPERGQPFTIEMAFEVRDVLPDIDVALIVVDELGAVIFDDAVRDRASVGTLSGEPGVYVVSATIPPVLRAGRYLVRGWIGNRYESSVDHDLLQIRIAPRTEDPREFMERTRAVQPEIDWQVKRQPLP